MNLLHCPRCIHRAALLLMFAITAMTPPAVSAQTPRKIIIDQDAAGPGGTNMQAILALINSRDVDVLGITVVTGDGKSHSLTLEDGKSDHLRAAAPATAELLSWTQQEAQKIWKQRINTRK